MINNIANKISSIPKNKLYESSSHLPVMIELEQRPHRQFLDRHCSQNNESQDHCIYIPDQITKVQTVTSPSDTPCFARTLQLELRNLPKRRHCQHLRF